MLIDVYSDVVCPWCYIGKVLVEHGGEELLIPEGELEGHLGHGDEIIDPTGRAAAEQGRG